MVVQLIPIKDPGLHDKDGKQASVPISPPINKEMTLRVLTFKESKHNKLEDIAVKSIASDSKLSALPTIVGKDSKFDCNEVCFRALDLIE